MQTKITNKKVFFALLVSVTIFASCGSSSYVLKNVEGGKVTVDATFDKKQDREIASILIPYQHKKDSLMNIVIGKSVRTLQAYRPESPLSNLTADVLKEAAARYSKKNIDLAVMNVGGLRNSLPEGDITVGDIFEIFPFENHLCILTMDGTTLRKLLGQIAKVRGESISDVQMVITEDGSIKRVTVGGKVISSDTIYTIATIDYLSEGNDHMEAFREAKSKECYPDQTIRNIIMNYVIQQTKKGKAITATVDGRIKIDK